MNVPLARVAGDRIPSDAYAIRDLFNQVWLTPSGVWEVKAEQLSALPISLSLMGCVYCASIRSLRGSLGLVAWPCAVARVI